MTNYQKENPATIQAMFSSIAASYDRTNAVLSFNMHKLWNRSLINHAVVPYAPATYLDLCCGTGEIALTYLKKSSKQCNAYLLDFSDKMLQCAEEKAQKQNLASLHQLHYLCADAQSIPLQDSHIDCGTISYGIRNVKDPKLAMSEIYRVLRPGGTLGILELTRPTNPFLRIGHQIYLRTTVPLLGWCFSANAEAYQYLCRSIKGFVEPKKLEIMLREVGFKETTTIPLSGGIATILLAKKSL